MRMRIGIGILIWLCCILEVLAQPNLVPNPSFEDYMECPAYGSINDVVDWKSVLGSVDYYHSCTTHTWWDVPSNFFGYQEDPAGQAYIGVAVCASPMSIANPLFSNAREFVGGSLSRALEAGQKYQVQFFSNLSDIMCYAIKNMGAYLSNGQPSDQIEQLLSLQPQISYEGEAFLDDKEGWIRISGTFTAQGGENFITIGNFDDDDNTDTLAVPCNNSGQLNAYYYIDDVSVIHVDSLVGIGEREETLLNIYPNPVRVYFTIEIADWSDRTLGLLDMAGREVLSVALHSSRQSIAIEGIPAGVYVAVVEQHGAVIGRRKVVVE